MPKNCSDCKFALFHDYGYSNWTVEGTDFHCLKEKHPDGSFDRFYLTDGRLGYAEKCQAFVKGDPVNLDVDMEEMYHHEKYSDVYTTDPEIKPLLDRYQGLYKED